MAAFTNITPDQPYPGFINTRFEGGNVVITARGDAILKGDDPKPNSAVEAPMITLTIPQHDWDQLVAEATRERGLVPGG